MQRCSKIITDSKINSIKLESPIGEFLNTLPRFYLCTYIYSTCYKVRSCVK